MGQVAAAEICHLEIDVAQIESGQIGTAEIKSLKTAGATVDINHGLLRQQRGDKTFGSWLHLTAQLRFGGSCQKKTNKLLAGNGRVVLRWLRVLF